jgi:hypothetical protein
MWDIMLNKLIEKLCKLAEREMKGNNFYKNWI